MPAIYHNPRQRKPIIMKAKSWSHQDDLTNGVGKKIVIHTASEIIEGRIIAADQFSVKVLAGNITFPRKQDGEVVVFKSAIRYFEVIA